ncbi:MAG: hypothetical protein RLZZ399_2807 [Verrucomicrobiota bacterium]|jgi:uncharacterized membrane protein
MLNGEKNLQCEGGERAGSAGGEGVGKLDPGYVNAMSHFYRGELGRIMAWRARLDATTNWAITVTSTVLTVAFSIREVPHVIFFFNLAVVWMLLWIEARRYRFYDAFRARVRMLEAHFIVPMVLQNHRLLQGDWQRLMCEDLFLPRFKISKFEALGRRLKRNYIYLFTLILSAWVTKVFLHAPLEVRSWSDFYAALGAGHGLPPWLVVAVVCLTFVVVLGTTIYISRNSPGEFNEFGPEHGALWKI